MWPTARRSRAPSGPGAAGRRLGPAQPGAVWARRSLPQMCREPLRLGRYRDLPVDDLLLEVVQLGLDVVHHAAAGRVANAVSLQVEPALTGGELALAEVLDEREHRVVDPLEHRGHDHGLEARVR